MNYLHLLHILEELDEEQLSCDVIANIDDEYFPIKDLKICNQKVDDRLDDGHPYFEVE